MLNIVQHGDQFELRIDNQSFQHMYHMERTKRAFVYENGEDNNGAEEGSKKEEEEVGYGGYKRGHQGTQDWQAKSDVWQAKKQEREEELADVNEMWKPKREEDVRQKRYDEVSPPKQATKPQQPTTFDFNAFGT